MKKIFNIFSIDFPFFLDFLEFFLCVILHEHLTTDKALIDKKILNILWSCLSKINWNFFLYVEIVELHIHIIHSSFFF